MIYTTLLLHALVAASAYSGFAEAARKPANSVLLSNVKTLTVYNGKETSHRRMSALPQVRFNSLDLVEGFLY